MATGQGRPKIRLEVAAALAALCLLVWVPQAQAAAPSNDDFANREVLNGTLPIEVSRSNVEATKESEEFLGLFSSAGHSVWFEWEATEGGWVTIGGCDADFADLVGVYTGAAVNALTRVASGNSAEGPHCRYTQREYTFKATAGAKYEIAVDGNAFYLPEFKPPVTEGAFDLWIEATPPPPNDDFANATPLVSTLEEEFEGEAFYFGSQLGYNWNATSESGDPEFVGGPGGGSVWYSWTAPVSGEVKVGGPCCGAPNLRLGIYTGDTLEGLLPYFGDIGPGDSVSFAVSAGDTYRLAIYGLIDESSAKAAMGSFEVQLSMRVQVPEPAPEENDGESPPPTADTTPPDTKIFTRVLKRLPPIWIFHFHSSEPGSTFRCRLDRHPFSVCPSTLRYRRLRPGRHVLRAFAIDAVGNVDASPATVRFRVPKSPRHRHGAAKRVARPLTE